jgi:hypothetical protein
LEPDSYATVDEIENAGDAGMAMVDNMDERMILVVADNTFRRDDGVVVVDTMNCSWADEDNNCAYCIQSWIGKSWNVNNAVFDEVVLFDLCIFAEEGEEEEEIGPWYETTGNGETVTLLIMLSDLVLCSVVVVWLIFVLSESRNVGIDDDDDDDDDDESFAVVAAATTTLSSRDAKTSVFSLVLGNSVVLVVVVVVVVVALVVVVDDDDDDGDGHVDFGGGNDDVDNAIDGDDE